MREGHAELFFLRKQQVLTEFFYELSDLGGLVLAVGSYRKRHSLCK